MKRKSSAAALRAALTLIVIILAAASSAVAAKETTLHNFDGSDGCCSYSGLVQDGSGNLYGTATFGGANGDGDVFELTPDGNGKWTFNVIYSFTGGADGKRPESTLILDSEGNLYGTCLWDGNGTVFELSPGEGGWILTRTYDFNGTDGASPTSNVILDSAGNLYGTTYGGGSGNGTVYELTPSGNTWTEQTLYTFTGGNDGGQSYAGLVMDASGNLYGTTSAGGANQQGVVFELQKGQNGWQETVLYAFTGNANDGSTPIGGVILDKAGNLYGTVSAGGQGGGGVFELQAAKGWQIDWLYQFSTNAVAQGLWPQAAVVFDSAGNLYGTATAGGTGDNQNCGGWACGVVYKLTAHKGNKKKGTVWTEKVLWSFDYDDGVEPSAPLILDSAGNLYSTTYGGGADQYGTVFKVKN